MFRAAETPPLGQVLTNWSVNVGSVLICLLLLPARFPGMDLAGIASPNWPLIWVVAWSIKRNIWQAMLAGLVLGLMQDGMGSSHPTHTLGLVMVGVLTALMRKERYIKEDFISVALITFLMAIAAETVMALQYLQAYLGPATEVWHPYVWKYVWTQYQLVALSSAVLSSLWAPVVYFPLSRLWARHGLSSG
jgi:rod shape-determining protein MreD